MRALQTVPDDPVVRAQYGIYPAFRGCADEARRNLDIGDRGLCATQGSQYQIGFANLHLRAYRAAQLNAMRAERRRLPGDGLKNALVQAGKWDAALTLPAGPAMDCPDPDAEATSVAVPASGAEGGEQRR